MNIVDSDTRLYGEGGRSGKHEVWLYKDLEVDMHLKGLHGIVKIGIWTRPWGGRHRTRINDESKCLAQGDSRDKGGICKP